MKCPRCGRTLDIERGKAFDVGRVAQLDSLVDDVTLRAIAVDVPIARCMTVDPPCGYLVAGAVVEGHFRKNYDLVPETAVLEAFLAYRQNNANNRYPPHEPGE
jgi:hypothetical protein